MTRGTCLKAVRACMAVAAISACMASGSALAAKTTHQCTGEDGTVTFTEKACTVRSKPPPPPEDPPCPLTREERQNAERLEGQFLTRFPDEDKHRAASFAGLANVFARIRLTQGRLSDLKRERKSIDDELGFYVNRPVPPDLQGRVDANDARFAAITEVFAGLENEVKTMMERYECERRQFGMLWHGGAPGSSACAPACRAGT